MLTTSAYNVSGPQESSQTVSQVMQSYKIDLRSVHKLPILPPFAYGASRSTTFSPVSRISCSILISTNGGASAWISATLSHSSV